MGAARQTEDPPGFFCCIAYPHHLLESPFVREDYWRRLGRSPAGRVRGGLLNQASSTGSNPSFSPGLFGPSGPGISMQGVASVVMFLSGAIGGLRILVPVTTGGAGVSAIGIAPPSQFPSIVNGKGYHKTKFLSSPGSG